MMARRRHDPRTTTRHPGESIRALGLVGLALSVVLLPNTVSGALTPISHDRQVSTFAFLDTNTSPDALRTDELIESATDGVFSEHAICHLASLGSEVTATSDQVSEITLDQVAASFQSSAAVTVSSQQHSGLGIASGGILYEFAVDTATQLRMTGHVIASGGASFDLSVRSPSQGFLLQAQWSSTDQDYEHLLLLSPGSYRLAVGGGGDGTFGPLGSGYSDLSASIDARFLPAADATTPPLFGAPASLAIVPNPVRSGAEIVYQGPIPAGARVTILDPSGREVRAIDLPAGSSGGARLDWDRRDRWNRELPAGIYLVRVDGGPSTRAVLLR